MWGHVNTRRARSSYVVSFGVSLVLATRRKLRLSLTRLRSDGSSDVPVTCARYELWKIRELKRIKRDKEANGVKA